MPGPRKGTGGHGRRKLAGKGPTPRAEDRPGHPARRRAARAAAETRATGRRPSRDDRPGRRGEDADEELVIGRNPVLEALRAKVPASVLLVALGAEADPRIEEARKLAERRGIPISELPRTGLDRRSAGAPHQGLGLVVPGYHYSHPDDLLSRVPEQEKALLVALDGVTDPRNLGSIVRSAAAFGAHGIVVPERRAAGVTSSTWKASAGALARLPVARATNLVRTLQAYRNAGVFVVGLAADGEIPPEDLEMAVDPLVLVIGSEGRGLSRLVGEQCDLTVAIPMSGPVESLNAGVAAGIALAEVSRHRRTRDSRPPP